jgi:uncharacterized protein YjbJ (UPF0337 family)
MTDDRIEGAVREGVGHVQDAVGGLVGDEGTQIKGKLNQAAGSVQNAYGKARGAAESQAKELYGEFEDFAQRRPLASIGIGVSLGVVLGFLMAQSRD